MKKISLLILIAFFISCTERNDDVKIIENYDAEYYSESEVDQIPGDDAAIEILMADLQKAVENAARESDTPAKAYVNIRIYINEEGKVDGIKELPLSAKLSTVSKEENKVDQNKLTKAIAGKAKYWDFTPAKKNGEPVKFRADLEMVYNVSEAGTITEEMPALKSMGKTLSQLPFNKNEDVYFVAVEEQPSPVGGMMAIQEKIQYPVKAKENGVEGRVFVKAYINEEGTVDRTEILKGIGSGCDSVAMKAIMDTKFTPGKQRGEPVKVQVSIPIVFKLQ